MRGGVDLEAIWKEDRAVQIPAAYTRLDDRVFGRTDHHGDPLFFCR